MRSNVFFQISGESVLFCLQGSDFIEAASNPTSNICDVVSIKEYRTALSTRQSLIGSS